MISVEVCMDILSLHRQGMSNRAIAHKLGIHRNTVKKYIEKGGLPAYKENVRQTSILDPYRQLIDGRQLSGHMAIRSAAKHGVQRCI